MTTVSASAVRGHCTIGEQCTIIMNKKEYTGKVAAKGTNVIYIYHILKSFTGTRAEMDRLEDKFVIGEWTPPFVAPSPVPTRKRKTKKNTVQPSPAPKRKKDNKKSENNMPNNLPMSNFDLQTTS